MAKQTRKPAATSGDRGKKGADGATPGAKTDTATKAATGAKPRTRGTTGATKAKDAPDLDAMRTKLFEVKAQVEKTDAEATTMEDAARKLRTDAKATLRDAVAPYRDACRQAGVPCEFTTGRATNVSERVSFDVVKVAKGLKVTVKGRTETEEIIPLAKLKVSIGKSAEHYCEKHIGPRAVVGNKQGSLGNRLRAALRD